MVKITESLLSFFLCMSAYYFVNTIHTISGQLVVNMRDKGGDVIKQKVDADIASDTVTLEFFQQDGVLITQFIDFKSDIQIFRAYVPWEEERGVVLAKPQMLCFVIRFGKNEFISSDAMSKLRQKNPTAIRIPEEEKGLETHIMDLELDLSATESVQTLSPHIYNICKEAPESTYTKESDLNIIARTSGKDGNTWISRAKKLPPAKYNRCKDTTDPSKPCACPYQICVGWYPCGLKYCHGRDSTGKIVNYRCGIKTCKRCINFEHVALQKIYCLWDDV